MKIKLFILIVTFIFTTMNLFGTTVNGRFVVITNDGVNYVVKLQLNTDTGIDDMGGATIIFNFNNSDLSIAMDDATTVSPSAYTFHNFSGGNYSTATITRPLSNQLWLNIELNSDNNGTVVAQAPNWTDLVTITFSTLNASGSSGLTWQTSSTFWSIFDGDNSTKWVTGTFTDENTTPLPVELTTFSVTNKKGSAVDLKWETATEVNNYGFEVERSVIKKSDKLNSIESADRSWEKIGFIEGHGNSNSPKKYSFVDKNLVGGSHFVYRLKQVDVDGSFEYSEAIEIEVLPVKYQLDQNYPNPFNPTTTIKFSLPQAGKVRLDVYNLLGELITTLVNKNFEAGFQSVQFNASNLASGIYIYRLSSNSFSQVRKMMLLK